MKSWIVGILIVCMIVAGGILLSTGFAGNNNGPDGQGTVNPQTNTESRNMLPNTIDSSTAASSADEDTATSADEKVSAAALTCTIIDSGDYVVDLRLRNQGSDTRSITIHPSGTKMDLLPKQTYRFDLHLAQNVPVLNISIEGTELPVQVQSPPCTTGGSSGSGFSGLAMEDQNPSRQTPPPPVPELSPLVLTLVGISGLLILTRIRKV